MKYFSSVPGGNMFLTKPETNRFARFSVLFAVCILLSMRLFGQSDIDSTLKFTDAIRLNQIGFYTYSPKLAVVCNDTALTYQIYTADWSKVVFRGKLSDVKTSNLSGKKTRHA